MSASTRGEENPILFTDPVLGAPELPGEQTTVWEMEHRIAAIKRSAAAEIKALRDDLERVTREARQLRLSMGSADVAEARREELERLRTLNASLSSTLASERDRAPRAEAALEKRKKILEVELEV